MKTDLLSELAAELHRATLERRTVPPLTETHPSLTLDDAYAIQRLLEARVLAAGEVVVGRKIGVTSRAVQEMLGVHQPDFGFLTRRMVYRSDSSVRFASASLIQPRAEGEVAFRLGRDLMGPGVTAADVLEATEAVVAAIEVVDSRIDEWRIRIEDTVADNASCGVLVLGEAWRPPGDLDLAAVEMDLYRNGAHEGHGVGSAVQGHPANAVAWLANTLGERGVALKKGDLVLSGALSKLVPITVGDSIELVMTTLGSVRVRFTE